MKRFFGILLLLCGAAFLFVVFRPEQEDPVASAAGAGRVFASSQECRECHAEIYEQWERSSHAIAWTDPAVRKLSNDFANQDCIDCHAPRPVLVTGIGERVLPRTTRRHEGVDCLACHLLPDGRIAGTVTNDRALCRPVATLDLAKPEFCAGCHHQHKTVDQWRESQWPDRDQDCSSCHMPYPLGDPNQARDHFFPGGKEDMAAAVLAEIDGWFATRIFKPLREEADAARAIADMLKAVEVYFKSGRRVCLVGALALNDSRDLFAPRIRGYFAAWTEALESALIRAGHGPKKARGRAEETLATIQGALVLGRALHDPAVFPRILARLKKRLVGD